MTLLHIEGFEGIVSLATAMTQVATEDDTLEFLEKHYGGRFFISNNQFHIRQAEDGKSHALGGGQDGSGSSMYFDYWFDTIGDNTVTYTIGMRIKTQTADRDQEIIKIMGSQEPDVAQVRLLLGLNNTLVVKRGGVTLATSANDVTVADTWHYIEFQCLIDISVGLYEVKVDGSSVLSATGVNTRNSSAIGDPAGVQFVGPVAASTSDSDTFMMDDIYILDDNGSINNDFLGPFRVHLFNLGTVDTSDFAKYGAGSDEVTSVADLPFDDTEGVDSVNTSTNEQRYAMVAFHTDAIKGVQITSRSGNTTDKSELVEVKHKIDSNASTDSASSYTIYDSVTHRGFYSTHEVDPDTSVLWTKAGLNAATFGVEIG